MNPLITILDPIRLRVEFRDPRWNVSKPAAWAWLGLAVAADLFAQAVAGTPNWITVVASLLTLTLGFMPRRWVMAVSGLYVGQALVSLALVWALSALGLPHAVIVGAGVVWAVWCWFALGILTLRYVRTPRLRGA